MSDEAAERILELTAQIVSSYVSTNPVDADSIPLLLQTVWRAFTTDGMESAKTTSRPSRPPPVSVERSVFPDFIICLEDGMKLKMLKRHLKTTYGMTPEDYRTKWDLPADYPLIAPNYSKYRSILAKKMGLGQKPSAQPSIIKLPARRAKGTRG